jgi:cyclophilin family peptidyl-prolyl cis-trans isomerase
VARALPLLILVMLVALAPCQPLRPPKGQTWLTVEIENRGTIAIQLHTKEAPKTTAHIRGLAERRFYDDQRVHRVEKSPRPYIVQLGDPLSKSSLDDARVGSGGSGARIPFEDTGFPNVAGAVGLAALPEQKDTGDSQFYILLADARLLDGKYTVFGQVVRGMDVLQKVERGDRVLSVRSVVGQ